jgi:hypothetical protein
VSEVGEYHIVPAANSGKNDLLSALVFNGFLPEVPLPSSSFSFQILRTTAHYMILSVCGIRLGHFYVYILHVLLHRRVQEG